MVDAKVHVPISSYAFNRDSLQSIATPTQENLKV